jgi:hypothetical protein
MRVDEVFDRLLRDGFDRGLDLVVQRRVLAVHHDDPVFRHRDRDISALALQHVAVIAESRRLDFDFGEIHRMRWSSGRLLLCEDGSG